MALLASGLPMKLGLVAGAIAGIAAGVAAEKVFHPAPQGNQMTSQIGSYGWTLWLIIAGMAFVTIMNRAGFILLSGKFSLPAAVQRALKYAPAGAGGDRGSGYFHVARAYRRFAR